MNFQIIEFWALQETQYLSDTEGGDSRSCNQWANTTPGFSARPFRCVSCRNFISHRKVEFYCIYNFLKIRIKWVEFSLEEREQEQQISLPRYEVLFRIPKHMICTSVQVFKLLYLGKSNNRTYNLGTCSWRHRYCEHCSTWYAITWPSWCDFCRGNYDVISRYFPVEIHFCHNSNIYSGLQRWRNSKL